jgi:hypothetical protein
MHFKYGNYLQRERLQYGDSASATSGESLYVDMLHLYGDVLQTLMRVG